MKTSLFGTMKNVSTWSFRSRFNHMWLVYHFPGVIVGGRCSASCDITLWKPTTFRFVRISISHLYVSLKPPIRICLYWILYIFIFSQDTFIYLLPYQFAFWISNILLWNLNLFIILKLMTHCGRSSHPHWKNIYCIHWKNLPLKYKSDLNHLPKLSSWYPVSISLILIFTEVRILDEFFTPVSIYSLLLKSIIFATEKPLLHIMLHSPSTNSIHCHCSLASKQ